MARDNACPPSLLPARRLNFEDAGGSEVEPLRGLRQGHRTRGVRRGTSSNVALGRAGEAGGSARVVGGASRLGSPNEFASSMKPRRTRPLVSVSVAYLKPVTERASSDHTGGSQFGVIGRRARCSTCATGAPSTRTARVRDRESDRGRDLGGDDRSGATRDGPIEPSRVGSAEVAVRLRSDGHSYRAIAGALGVSHETIRKDTDPTVNRLTVEPDRIVGLDGKSRPARRPTVIPFQEPTRRGPGPKPRPSP